MMPYLFKIGNFEVRIYSLMYVLSLVIAIIFLRKRARSLGYNPQILENIAVALFISGLIGARGYYVIMSWDFYKNNPMEIFAIWHGGLAIHGGIIGGLIGTFIYAKFTDIKALFICDMIAPFLLLGQAIGRFGNFANGEAHGVPTITPPEIIFKLKPIFLEFWYNALYQLKIPINHEGLTKLHEQILSGQQFVVNFQGKDYILKEYVPWGISFPATYMPPAYMDFATLAVHPTFFYEMILNFIGAAILFYFWKKDKYISSGFLFGLYLVFYSVIRSFVTMFRADDLMVGALRAPHLAGLIFIFLGTVLVIYSKKYLKKNQ